EYHQALAAAKQDRFPSLLLLQYAAETWSVVNLVAVHRANITPEMLEPRKPLASGARRTGWQGCHINLERIPAAGRVVIVKDGVPRNQQEINRAWSQIDRFSEIPTRNRAWLLDVLRVVERLPIEFELNDVYSFESSLASLHPANRHIRAKIRQQLQLLRDQGLVEFCGRGNYRRLA
ncbi:MAG: restriction endonuclease, partial [Chloroflexi bacterium]|nr:restriction endonuclease [Chloroflexota bacterium]